MSTGKRISVSDQALQAVREARSLQQLQRDVPRLVTAVRDETRSEFNREIAAVRQRQGALDRSLSELSDRAQEIDRQSRQRIATVQRAFEASIGEAREMIHAQQAALAEERTERKRQVREVKKGIARLEEKGKSALLAAGTWLEDARSVIALIDAELPHNRFAPGALDRLRSQTEMAADNAAGGFGEAALSSAQAAYVDSIEVRDRVELAELEWLGVRASAVGALSMLKGLIEENRQRKGVSRTGEELPEVDLDVDYWSNGRLAELATQTDERLASARSDDPPMSTADLAAIVGEWVPEAEDRLRQLVADATVNQAAAQLRIEIAEIAIAVLEGENYMMPEPAEAGWVGSDDRNPFVARVRNAANPKDDVVLYVSPAAVPAAGEKAGGWTLELATFSEDVQSEVVLGARGSAIAEALNAAGIEVGRPVADAQVHTRAAERGVEQLLRRKG